ncbi:MAG: 2-oxo acid dehydrogenase subunit E2 [Streptosporangiaceae bacterium]
MGAQLAVIEDSESGDAAPAAAETAAAETAEPSQLEASQPEPSRPKASQPEASPPDQAPAASSDSWGSQPNYAPPAPSYGSASPGFSGSSGPSTPAYAPPPAYGQPQPAAPYGQQASSAPAYGQPAPSAPYGRPALAAEAAPAGRMPAQGQPSPAESAPSAPPASADAQAEAEEYPPPTPLPSGGDAPYVTPLVRKLAAEHAVNLETISGTGVGGRIRKQDVIEAARAQRAAQPQQQPVQAQTAPPQTAPPQTAPPQTAPPQPQQVPQQPQPPQVAPAPQEPRPAQSPPAPRPAVVPSSLRGTTQRMSRPRQVIAQRMVESLQVSAQLTTVVEADVTAIARLRDLAKQDFEAREGVKLSFLPFFALAAVEALKVHPKLNAVIDGSQVTYHDAEHVGIAVDTERGLMVPVIHNAGDLNIGGLARKIGDLANRTRSGQVAPDELAGGTFTLTNTGSRGALFDTPIINQPQVAILGTGTVVKRPVVVEDPALGEVIAVRSMVYLALTYDHRLVDGADAARFLTTVKNRLEEGSFEAELGL